MGSVGPWTLWTDSTWNRQTTLVLWREYHLTWCRNRGTRKQVLHTRVYQRYTRNTRFHEKCAEISYLTYTVEYQIWRWKNDCPCVWACNWIQYEAWIFVIERADDICAPTPATTTHQFLSLHIRTLWNRQGGFMEINRLTPGHGRGR